MWSKIKEWVFGPALPAESAHRVHGVWRGLYRCPECRHIGDVTVHSLDFAPWVARGEVVIPSHKVCPNCGGDTTEATGVVARPWADVRAKRCWSLGGGQYVWVVAGRGWEVKE